MWDDLVRLCGNPTVFAGRFDVIAVNDVAMHFPGPLKHLYSNNTTYLKYWVQARRDQFIRMFGPVGYTHSCSIGSMVTWPWPGCGTSALGAVYTGLALGYNEVILCGIPLDDSGHYFETPATPSSFSKQVPPKGNGEIKYWQKARDEVFMNKVRSMSGRTAELLGAP